MLFSPFVLALAVAVPTPPPSAGVVVIPFGVDVPSRALSEVVEGALPAACAARGLAAVRADKVKPAHEALLRCADDACRVKQAERLGARWVVVAGLPNGALEDNALSLRILDGRAQDQVERARVRIEGAPPALHAQVTGAVDSLLERVAPMFAHQRAVHVSRARRAEAHGELEVADEAWADAARTGPLDDEAAELWLARARMWDRSGDRARAWSVWDALARDLLTATSLDDSTKAKLGDAVRDHLMARATFQMDRADHDGGPDKPALLAEAARTWLDVARLVPAERARAMFSAAELFRDAGQMDEARHLYEEVANDPAADEELRVRSLARAKL